MNPGQKLACIACCGTGLFIVFEYAGILPWAPGLHPEVKRAVFQDPYHWQVLCIGLAFLSAGLLFLIPKSQPMLGRLLSLVFLGSLIAGITGSFLAR